MIYGKNRTDKIHLSGQWNRGPERNGQANWRPQLYPSDKINMAALPKNRHEQAEPDEAQKYPSSPPHQAAIKKCNPTPPNGEGNGVGQRMFASTHQFAARGFFPRPLLFISQRC